MDVQPAQDQAAAVEAVADAAALPRRPLSRFRVIDLTHARAGPATIRQLSDWGADVIRVERPAGVQEASDLIGQRDGSDFQNLHRNKRSIGIDLKSDAGREVFLRLAKDADVIVENMRSDVKFRLGVDYESIRAINPGIVYGSISGFGQTGPYATRGGVDQIAQGMGGLMSITGEPGGAPMRVGIPISDLCAGMFMAQGILIALLDREVSGQGTWVKTSLLQSMIAMLDFQVTRWTVDGEVPTTAGNHHPTGVPMGTFQTRDAWMNIAASSQRLFSRFCAVAGLDWMLDDPRFATVAARKANGDAVKDIVSETMRERDAADWDAALTEVGVPCGPVLNISEVFANPQTRHLDVTRRVTHPKLGPLDLGANALDIDGATKDLLRPTPEVGQHTEEVLRNLGLGEKDIADLRSRNVI